VLVVAEPVEVLVAEFIEAWFLACNILSTKPSICETMF